MRRIISFLSLLFIAVATSAQSPEALRESLSKYPNLAYPVYSPYPSIPLGEIATTPEGFEPFYFYMVGRHGSRYETSDSRFNKVSATLNKAHDLGILTKDGELLRAHANAIAAAQKGHDGELSDVGVAQWRAIAQRAYNRFSKVFDGGSIEGKSSYVLRCIFSMVAFNDAIKEKNPKIAIYQQARSSEQYIVRPMSSNPASTKEFKSIIKEYDKNNKGNKARKAWEYSYDASEFMSKITTDSDRLLAECGGKRDERIMRYSYITLLFGENFGLGDRELLGRLFSVEDLYYIYVYQTSFWVNKSMGRGNEYVEARQSQTKPLIMDIINNCNDAIANKNPHRASVRFSHDTQIGPFLSAMGYDGCVPQWNENVELSTTSFNLGTILPMATNLQIILYRNKSGKIFVRSLINERDATLPIKSKTAPFYSWEEFSKYILNNLKTLQQSTDSILQKARENGNGE